MIIKDTGLFDVEYEGDQFKYTHGQYVAPVMEEIKLTRENSSDGFSDDRTMRMIGKIPVIEFLKHPEWMHDGNLILKWLQSDEGRNCVVHKIDTGRSGKVIIK